jgi:hypothetical protein
MTTHHPKNCAAVQAHSRLVSAATRVLKFADRSRREGYAHIAHSCVELTTDLLFLTSLLHRALNNYVPDEAEWKHWLDRVRLVAGKHNCSNIHLEVLLESLLIVRWGDAGAMFVSPLPTRQARARFGKPANEGTVQP